MSLLFNILPRFILAFSPGSKCLLISWLQSPSTAILAPKKTKLDIIKMKNFCSVADLVGLPDGSVLKNLPVNAGDVSLILGSGRFPREGNGNLLPYSFLGNPMDKGAWQDIPGVTEESDTT